MPGGSGRPSAPERMGDQTTHAVVGVADSRTFRVLWVLEGLGLPYAHRPERQQSMAVRALHPAGKIPVMLDGDNTLTDSTAIAQ
jgi:glutathione S-transferase